MAIHGTIGAVTGSLKIGTSGGITVIGTLGSLMGSILIGSLGYFFNLELY